MAETVNSRTFVNPKSYYFPIPANEVKRAPNLGQNPGWDTGSASNE
ncbi:RagB/SusD family nutrient uptake outer membrane protein [Bacteroides thetaiotaomicron]|nr:RagB/SusD family nutrient uptake outer membrane protein [Bacteroides thetaiotaomicron]